jgi:hypothetical protein
MLIHKKLHVTVSAKIFGEGPMKSWFSAMNISVLFWESKEKRQRGAVNNQGKRAYSFKVPQTWKTNEQQYLSCRLPL